MSRGQTNATSVTRTVELTDRQIENVCCCALVLFLASVPEPLSLSVSGVSLPLSSLWACTWKRLWLNYDIFVVWVPEIYGLKARQFFNFYMMLTIRNHHIKNTDLSYLAEAQL